jgi:large subunit ribosomal protein L9
VKAGFGRNFLLPQGKAVAATETNKKVFEVRRAELHKKQAEILAVAQAAADKLTAVGAITIASKAGEEGKLFGSVGTRDIAEALAKVGVDVVKADVRLPTGALRMVGEYEVDIALHAEVTGKAKIVVIAQ